MTLPSPMDRSISHLLHRASQAAEALFADKGDGVTARQLVVLVCVSERQGLSQTDIVEGTGIDRSTLADIVRRLCKGGLLQRRRSREDARTYHANVTDAGRKVLAAGLPRLRVVDDKVLAALDKGRRGLFVEGLAAIAAAMTDTQVSQAKISNRGA